MTFSHSYPLYKHDSEELSELAKGLARNKISELKRALKGRITEHQVLMLKHQLVHIERLSEIIEELNADIIKKTEKSRKQIILLDEMPGIGEHSAERIVAEAGIDMKQFKNGDHFCSWIGLVPECKESAGKDEYQDTKRK